MLTFIIPCYNRQQKIEKCFESLQKQTEHDFEAIFIDDASLDDTFCKLLELQNLAKFKMVVTTNAINLGPGETRNVGIKLAVGDYISFLDSDDVLSENAVENIIMTLRQHENIDCVIFDFYIQKGSLKIKYKTNYINKEWLEKKEFLLFTNTSTWCKVYRKSILIDNGIRFPDMRKKEDFVFNMLALIHCEKVYYLQKPLYYYIQNKDSIMHNPDKIDGHTQEIAFGILEESGLFSQDLLTDLAVNEYIYSLTTTYFSLKKSKKEILELWNKLNDKYPNWTNSERVTNSGKSVKIVLNYVKKKAYHRLKFFLRIQRFVKKILR